MAARRWAWVLARFLHRKQLPGEKEKNALARCQPRPVVPRPRRPSALRPFGKAFFSFSPPSGSHDAKKRAKAHTPNSISRPTTGFLHTLRLPTPLLCFWWHRLCSLGCNLLGGTGFPACATRGGTPRLHRPVVKLSGLGCNLLGGTGFPACASRGGTPRLHSPMPPMSCRRAVSARVGATRRRPGRPRCCQRRLGPRGCNRRPT